MRGLYPAVGDAVAGVIERPRLLRTLEAERVRVCIVQGPSGSGKTTLLRSWASRRDRVMWVSLGEGISTRLAFWQHVLESAERIGALTSESSEHLRKQLSVGVDPVDLAGAVLAETGPVVLVLDAYEHLGDAMTAIDGDLARLLATTPSLRLMLTTRAATALVDLHVPHGGIVRLVPLSELAMTVEEVGAIIAAQTGIEDERLAESVARTTRGFALTVRAVVLALSQLGSVPSVDSEEWDSVLESRLESLLPDDEAIRFVTDTCVPPYVDAELARELTGHPAAAELMAMLERNGFGRWIPYRRHAPVFQYVETIRDAFRRRAIDDAARFERSCATTARWLLGNDEIAQALRFAIDGADYALADRIFVSLVISTPESYVSTRFLATLRTVPEDVLPEHPMLAFGLGLSLMASPILRGEAPRIFRIAVDSRARPSYVEPTIDAFTLAGMRAVCLRLALRFQEGADASVEAVRLASGLDPALQSRHGEHVGTILRQLGYTLLFGGRVDDALAAVDRSIALCSSDASRNYSIVFGACAAAFAGDLALAKAYRDSIDHDAWPRETRDTSMHLPALAAEAQAQLDDLEFERALETIRRAEPFMRTNEQSAFLTGMLGTARLGIGQAEAEAEAERVTRMLAAAVAPPGIGDNVATERLVAMLAHVRLAGGDHRAAAALLDPLPQDRPHLAAARIACLLAAGRAEEALELARSAVALQGGTRRTLAETHVVGAAAALRKGDARLAWTWLSAATLSWESAGPRMHVVLLSARDRTSLQELARMRGSSRAHDYLHVPGREPSGDERMPVALTPRERVVLAALAEHGSVKSIAESLFVSPHTVKTQLRAVYRKLGVSSRHAALDTARALRLLEPASRGGD